VQRLRQGLMNVHGVIESRVSRLSFSRRESSLAEEAGMNVTMGLRQQYAGWHRRWRVQWTMRPSSPVQPVLDALQYSCLSM
jgi:hypothetical protein